MKETLLILTPGFPAHEADTTCLPPQQVFVRSLKESYPDLEVIVISFRYPYHRSSYTWNGIPVISFGGKNKKGVFKWGLWRHINKKLEEINEQANIIGLLSFWCDECALIGKKFAGRHHKKHYSWILGQDARKNNRYINRIRPEPGELIALSDFIAAELHRNHGITPRHIIPPGIDPQLFQPDQPVKDIDLLGAGSLIPLKRFDIFLQVVAAIKKEFPLIRAVLAGEGPEKQQLKALAAELGVEENIQFTGELPHPEVLRLMQRAKTFLHPSSYEGFGVVCIEALYAGAAVISFCQPMKKEIPGWHIVATPETMIDRTIALLKISPENKPVAPFLIRDTVTAMMRLFGYPHPSPAEF